MKKYLYIQAWCQMLGLFPYFTQGEIAKACSDHAPETTICQRQDGTWAAFEEIQSPITKQTVYCG